MNTRSCRLDQLRKPQQERSELRVKQILDAARVLILENGCAVLTMSGIARNAQISISSIYQYYPNKQAIIASLAQHYLDLHLAHTEQILSATPENLEQLATLTKRLLDDYYLLHRKNPVMRDIWKGSATDKHFQSINSIDTTRYVALIVERSRHLFVPEKIKEVGSCVRLLANVGSRAVEIAAELDECESQIIITSWDEMLAACWHDTISKFARA